MIRVIISFISSSVSFDEANDVDDESEQRLPHFGQT